MYISDEDKHKERFAVRARSVGFGWILHLPFPVLCARGRFNTLNPRHNKYVESFENIRIIQKLLSKQVLLVLACGLGSDAAARVV